MNESNSDSADENQSEKIKAESSRLSNDCSGSTSKNESSHEDIDPLEGTSYQYKNSEPETDLSKRGKFQLIIAISVCDFVCLL